MSQRIVGRVRWLAPLLVVTLACSASTVGRSGEEKEELPELLGSTYKAKVVETVPDWAEAAAEAEIDLEETERLRDVAPGAVVMVYFGTWCSDSKREVARLWKILEGLGSDESATGLPFDVRYVGVDREKKQPVGLISTVDLRYVPTLVVKRGPLEVGRIVEEPLVTLEHDLAALLHGEASGILTSSRPELLEEAES